MEATTTPTKPMYSPPHANAHTSPAQWVLADPYLSFIGEGIELKKYHRHTNSVAKRKFFYHRGILAWNTVDSSLPSSNEDVIGIHVEDVIEITTGKAPQTFLHHVSKNAIENCCFSIFYNKTKSDGSVHTHSVDFEAPNEEMRDKIVDGLRKIVERAHQDKMKLKQADPLHVECKVDITGTVQVIIWNAEDKMAQDRREEMIRNITAQTNAFNSTMPRTPHSPMNQSSPYLETASFEQSPKFPSDFSKNHLSPYTPSKGDFSDPDHLSSNWESTKNNKDYDQMNGQQMEALKTKIEDQSQEIIRLKQLIAKMEIESARKDVLLSDLKFRQVK